MNASSPLLLESEKYMAAGLAAGCPFDQMLNFARAGLVHQPQQLLASAAARLCDQPEGPTVIGFGGARGGGKSHWLFAQLGADDCQRLPGLKCLLLRKVGKSNLEQLTDFRQRLFARLPHKFTATRGGLITFANGSRIIAGHFQCEQDIDAYLGLEYDVIGIEEATTLCARKYNDIVTCCRSSKPGWRPRVYATANPGGVGHVWFRNRLVLPFQLRLERDTRFIPATIKDNSFTNPEYRATLENLGGWQKRAWLDGDWDIAAGQFFTTFRREFHVVDDFPDGRAVEWVAGFDYGFNHYTVALLAAYDADRNLFIVDEHAARGWVPERHAEAIKAMCQRHGVTLNPRHRYSPPLSRFVAGRDLFTRQSNGLTIAGQYADLGIHLRADYSDRVNGWAAVLRGFGDPAAGVKPTLFIHRRCSRLLETIPCLQHDPNRPEDVLKVDSDEDGIGGDDAPMPSVIWSPTDCRRSAWLNFGVSDDLESLQKV